MLLMEAITRTGLSPRLMQRRPKRQQHSAQLPLFLPPFPRPPVLPREGRQGISVFSDYENADHANSCLIESVVYREQTIDVSNAGQTWTFLFDYRSADENGIESPSTAQAFIRVIDQNNCTPYCSIFSEVTQKTQQTHRKHGLRMPQYP